MEFSQRAVSYMSKSKKSSKYSKFKDIFIALDIESNMCYTATDIQNCKHRISVDETCTAAVAERMPEKISIWKSLECTTGSSKKE